MGTQACHAWTYREDRSQFGISGTQREREKREKGPTRRDQEPSDAKGFGVKRRGGGGRLAQSVWLEARHTSTLTIALEPPKFRQGGGWKEYSPQKPFGSPEPSLKEKAYLGTPA